ncbi:hypothetical protein [Prevotellamassilia timonensis]|uniref:hypothetical protein n=1 Tax=Prevotellamassilia timonensis TaxID=1852370 RepID=UPI0008D9DBDC|nr:hypothetical protein [Prevotellamassilia timonensis]
MKRLLFILFALQSIASYGQKFSITVKDAATKISLQGASVTILDKDWRTRQTLWRAVQMLTQKLSCQTIHDCPKVVPLHYESEWQ